MEDVFYIRPADSETARGPFDVEKLSTLADADQLTRETLYYDDGLESWAAIGSNRALTERIFPSKKQLGLRSSKQKPRSSEQVADDEREPVSVNEMLAAADGDTDEARHLKEAIRSQHRAASLAIPTLAAVCLISAATYLYPSWSFLSDLVNQQPGAVTQIFQRPLLILGGLDLLFGIILLLAATEIYPLLRFRAMLGMGFFGFLYGSAALSGDLTGLFLCLASVAYGVGVFICTLTLNLKLMVAAAAASLGGTLVFAFFTTFAPLLGY